MRKLRDSQSGFTILELMIATVIFAVLLMGAATMLVQIGRLYYKGVISARTQDTTRTIADDIGRTLQFSGEKITRAATPYRDISTPNGNVRVHAFCVGKVRYSYILDAQISKDVSSYEPGSSRQNYVPRALWRDAQADVGCTPLDLLSDVSATGGREMLGEGMRLFRFNTPYDNDMTGLAGFSVGVVYGADSDLIEFEGEGETIRGARCRGFGLGAQWCATSLLETTVFRRID